MNSTVYNSMNCLSIITEYLKSNGYDGLCDPNLE